MIRLAINGYGRIGRGVHRKLLADKNEDFEVVAINSRSASDSHAYLLKHDSLYGKLDANIEAVADDCMNINGKTVKVFHERDPKNIGWAKHDVDIVIESTGKFTKYADASKHLDAGAKDVLITAPCKDPEVQTLVMGVNDHEYDPEKYRVVSNASCTTNCLASVLKVMHDSFVVENAFVTTVHAFTHTQNLLDNSNPRDFRRARATTESIIPTTTGAMETIGSVIPDLDGKVQGMALRVPVPTVSVLDIVAKLEKDVTIESLNDAFKKAESANMQGILGTVGEPLVSVDFRGDSRSSIIDLGSTKVLDGNYVKVIAWYDNEWGYISRVVDLLQWVSRK